MTEQNRDTATSAGAGAGDPAAERPSAHPNATTPAANQRSGEPRLPTTTDTAAPGDDEHPDPPQRPDAGVFRPGAPSGEVAPQ